MAAAGIPAACWTSTRPPKVGAAAAWARAFPLGHLPLDPADRRREHRPGGAEPRTLARPAPPRPAAALSPGSIALAQWHGPKREPWSESDSPDAPASRYAADSRSAGAGRGDAGRGEGVRRDLDRWVSAGRQLVDGVSGARPGSRPAGRGAGRGAGGLPRLNDLGRWVEGKLDWILDDEDDWREPWEETQPRAGRQPDRRGEPAPAPDPARMPRPAAASSPRRPPEARSRRGAAAPSADPPAASTSAAAEDWPDEDSFTLPRWQRPRGASTSPPEDQRAPGRSDPADGGSGPRPMPRSSRRRPR